MSHLQYMLDEGEGITAQSFFIEFGFKSREFAEEEFKQAIHDAYKVTSDESLKSYLYREFIRNDFKMLEESTHLDLYWTNTVKELISDNTIKRKLDYALSHTKKSQEKRSAKDRRISQTITDNDVIDLSNEGSSSQRSDVIEWREFKELKKDEYLLPELHSKTASAVDGIMKKKITSYKRYMKSLSYQQQCPEDVLYQYKIITSVINAFYTNASLFDLAVIPEPSEFDINNQFWGPIIEALFTKSVVKIKSGDTVLKNIKQRFKVDYRLCIPIGNKYIDISTIEVGKNVTTTKVKDDHLKLVLEAKTIIARIVSTFYFMKPSSISVPTLQICRLKADLTSTTLESPSRYVTRRMCERIRAPMQAEDAQQMKKLLRSLILYKQQVEDLADHIKKEVNSAMDRRSSFGLVLEQSYKKDITNYHHWLDKTDVGED